MHHHLCFAMGVHLPCEILRDFEINHENTSTQILMLDSLHSLQDEVISL